MTGIPYCKNCKHLGLDGMFGLICDANGNNKNYDCSKYEEKELKRMTERNKDNIRIHLPLSFVEKLLHEFNSLNGLKAFDSKSERVVASGKKSPKPMDKNGFDYSIIDKRYSVPFDEVINLDFVEIIGLLEEVTNGDVE